MATKFQIFFVLIFLFASISLKAAGLVEWSSPEGIKRFESSKAKPDFYSLSNHFESQSNGIYCGPTSAVIVLNALRLRSKNLKVPKDYSVLNSDERKYLPKKYDATLERYTQRNVFLVKGKNTKSKELVLGKSNKKGEKDFGYQLRQYNALLKAHQLKTKLRIVNKKLDPKTIKNELINNLKTPKDYILVNYKRKSLGQKGGGHISPLGAYDETSDSFLIMDVNSSKATWVWVSSKDLIASLNTFDTIENRGYILIEEGL